MPKALPLFLVVAALTVTAVHPLPVRAEYQAAQQDKGDPGQMLEEGTQTILRAFELFLRSLPQYEAPEVLPNGDIIIRRKHPPQDGEDGKTPPPPAPDKTKT